MIAALEKHALDPDQTLLDGDRDLDTQAGRTAGIRTCLFGVSDLNNPAEIHITRHDQLLELLSTNEF